MAVTDTSYQDAAGLRGPQGWSQPAQADPAVAGSTNPLDVLLAEVDQEYETRARELEAQRLEMQQQAQREEDALARAAAAPAPAPETPQARPQQPQVPAEAEAEAPQERTSQERATQATLMQGARRRLAESQEGDGTVQMVADGQRTPREVERHLTDTRENLLHGIPESRRGGSPDERQRAREHWRRWRDRQRELHGPRGVDPMAFASGRDRARKLAAYESSWPTPPPPIPTSPGQLPPWRRNAPTPVPGLPPGLGDPPASSRRGALPPTPPGPGEPTGLGDAPRRRAAVRAARDRSNNRNPNRNRNSNRNRNPNRNRPSPAPSPEDVALDREAARDKERIESGEMGGREELAADRREMDRREGARSEAVRRSIMDRNRDFVNRRREALDAQQDYRHTLEEARLKAKERADRERRLGGTRAASTPLRPE